MSDQVIRLRLLTILVLSGFTAAVWLLPAALVQSSASQYLAVSFLDVGQGDAIFIASPTGMQVLIDGGRNSSVLRELGKVMPATDRTIDLVVATHPDADHIGGLIDVLERFTVSHILMTENVSNTEASKRYQALAAKEGATITYARRGQTFHLDASTTLSVLYPETDASTSESNASSIVLKLEHGQNSFMLTGDAPKKIEEYLVIRDGANLASDVLKVGHHGSRTSTSELFLAEVDPRYAVISAGADNRYGHPHVEVTDLLFNYRVETYSTAESGTITFLSDGAELWLK